MTEHAIRSEAGELINLLNIASLTNNPVEYYSSVFRAFEKAFANERGTNLLRSLKSNELLYNLARSNVRPPEDSSENSLSRNGYDELLRTLVRIRDNCAHLRGRTGYPPGDRRLLSEVQPYAEVVEALVRARIDQLTNEADEDDFNSGV